MNKMEIFSPLFKFSVLTMRRIRFVKYPLGPVKSSFSSGFFSIGLGLLLFGDCPKRTEYLQFVSAMFLFKSIGFDLPFSKSKLSAFKKQFPRFISR
jgi:hypothetical protein